MILTHLVLFSFLNGAGTAATPEETGVVDYEFTVQINRTHEFTTTIQRTETLPSPLS